MTVDELRVVITANTAGLTTAMSGVTSQMKRMQSQTNSASSGMQKAFGGIGNGIAKVGKVAVLAGAAIVGILGGALIKGAADAAAAQTKLAQMDAVLKSTGGAAGMSKKALVDLAAGLSKTTTFSKGTTIAAENLLLTFTGIGKKVFPATITAAQNMSTALGTDLNSSVMLLGKAMNDPVAGMGRLTKSGVTFTAQQKEQVKAMVAVGDKAGAQKLILAELNKEFGGSAAAAGKTFAGQMIILKNQISSVSASLGATLIPYLTKFLTFVTSNMPAIQTGFQTAFDVISRVVKVVADTFTTSVLPVLITLYNWVQTNMPQIQSIMTTVFNGIKTVVDIAVVVFKTLINALAGIGTWIINNQALVTNIGIVVASFAVSWGLVNLALGIWATVGVIATAVTTGFGVAVAFLTSPIGIVIIAIGAIIAIGVLLYKNWNTVKAVTIAVWTSIKTFFGSVFAGIKSTVSGAVNGIKSTITNVWNGIKSTTSSVFNAVKNSIMTPINSAVSLVSSAVNRIKGFFSGMHISFPKIKMPHFSISGSFSLAPPSMPKLGVSWYQNGGVFDKASMIGVGENGSEAVVPLERNLGWVDKMAQKITAKMDNKNGSGLNLTITNFVNNRSQDVQSLAEELQFYMKRQTTGGRG